MPNLYGDILSDIAAQIAGSVGLAGSANIGEHGAMFEAIHGSAPRRAGQNLANPSGLILASVLMLVHVGLPDAAATIHNAWLCTIEDGIHTYDIYDEKVSKEKVGTKEFAQAVVARLGKKPVKLKEAHYSYEKNLHTDSKTGSKKAKKELVGVDIFVDLNETVEKVHQSLNGLNKDLKLTMISNRGVKVWPDKMPETSCGDSWRCRFTSPEKGKHITHAQIAELLKKMAEKGIDFTHTEHLCTFDGYPGYTLGQDEQ